MNRKLFVLCLLGVGLCLPSFVNAGPLQNLRARSRFEVPCTSCANGQCTLPAVDKVVKPDQAKPDQVKAATATQDNVDLMQAVVAGFGSRPALGPYHFVTTAMRSYLADFAGGNKAGAVDRFSLAIGRTPNPARACRIATFAVVILPIVNSFQPIPDYAEVLAGLEALEAAACGTPVPVPTPTPVPAS